MDTNSKLKPENQNGPLIGLALGIVLITIFVLIGIFFGERIVDIVVGSLLALGAIFTFFIWYRTRNIGYLIFMLWLGLMSVRNLLSLQDPTLVLAYRIIIIPLLLLWLYVIFTGKITWHYRKILELAAKSVDGTADGFTPRPFPAGKAHYSKKDIIEFGKFLSKHLIAFPYAEANRVLLVISRKEPLDFLSLRRNYEDDTYVSFDFEGNMAVNIAKKEYDKYKEEITFDKLCQSLGKVFKEFLEWYIEGKSEKIINKMNMLRLNPFIET